MFFSTSLRRKAVIVVAAAMPSSIGATSALPKDSVYIHCRNDGGDYMISELNHAVWRYADRVHAYRPMCLACNVVQWGNVILIEDGARLSIRIDRLKGYMSVHNEGDGGDDDGAVEVKSFHGSCVRSQKVAGDGVAYAAPHRAF